jgi:electron transport complex protein RnfG
MRDYIKLGGTLLIISVVSAFLVAYVNQTTAPIIEAAAERAKLAAIERVLGQVEGAGEPVEFAKDDTSVTEIVRFEADDGAAYAVTAEPNGYGGAVTLMIGVNAALEVTGVSIIEMSETPGLGTKAKDEAFLNQLVGSGKTAAITGATITSKAVNTGVSDAVQ